MKRKLLVQGGIALTVLFTLAFGIGVGQASATTGCFTDTNGHWAEVFICWMADNAITSGTAPGVYSPEDFVTRAQMAVFMQKQAEIPPSTGDIYINAGLNDWVPNGTGGGSIIYYTNTTELHAPGAGTYGFQLTPDLPGSLYGRQMYTHSVKLCYDATHGASLIGVYFRQYQGGATPTIFKEVIDTTARIDKVCREYIFPTNGSLWGTDHVSLYLSVNFTSAASSLWIGANTFTLSPSANIGVLSNEEPLNERPILEAPQPSTTGQNDQ